MLEMVELKPCPFCGADAELRWVLDKEFGNSIRVRCSREGECPSPTWVEALEDHEDGAALLDSVTRFWNTRADDWANDEMVRLCVRLAQVEQELRIARVERDQAMNACEKITEVYGTAPPAPDNTPSRTHYASGNGSAVRRR